MKVVSLGIYISVPFCRTKCSYCNFASDVFSRAVFERYVDRVCGDIARAEDTAQLMGGGIEQSVDSIYLGGGTPTVIDPDQLQRMFHAVRVQFSVMPDAEVTVECAPGTLTPQVLNTLQRCGVNRVSLGVQSFVDREAAAVGRLHKRVTILDDIAHLRSCGITNINIDLIAGLPHQTAESWNESLAETLATGAPHVSVYMLEVDDDSRLGRELIAGGTRYHAHLVPDEDAVADFYGIACERLETAGIEQYEISNFARAGFESRHNLKYWTRRPYLGFGVDAHSMLPAGEEVKASGTESIRLATTDSLDEFLLSQQIKADAVSSQEALEETFFLGLRLNRGVKLDELRLHLGHDVEKFLPVMDELVAAGMLARIGDTIQLTARGRLLANEVFERFLDVKEEPAGTTV